MKLRKLATLVAVSLSAAGTTIPTQLLAAGPIAPTVSRPAAPAIADVAMHNGDVLLGVLVDPQGLPIAQKSVSIYRGQTLLGQTTTDKDGRWAVSGLSAGTYQVVSGEYAVACRLWTAGAAPPSAQGGLLLVDGPEALRGQNAWGGVFSSPIFWALVLATAITVPIAVSNNKKKTGS